MPEGVSYPVVSIVIPIFCEVGNLERLVNNIRNSLEPLGLQYEVFLIDDGSPDATWCEIERLSGSVKQLRGIRLSRNFGKEAALSAGLDQASGQAIVVMDGDLQHPAWLIPRMLELWRRGEAEVIEAVKRRRGKESPLYRIGAWLFYRLFRALTRYDLRGTSDFKLLDRRVLESWRLMPERVLFFRGMTTWLGFRRAQVEFDVAERETGRSGWSLLRLTRLALSAMTAFSSAPLLLMTLLGFGFGLFAFLLMIQTLWQKLSGAAVTGFTTVILLLLIVGSALMIGLGIVGEYLARIYDEVKGRPRYVVAATVASETKQSQGSEG